MSLKSQHHAITPVAKSTIPAAGRSRRLLLSRLREIDALSAKELAAITDDANKIKQSRPIGS